MQTLRWIAAGGLIVTACAPTMPPVAPKSSLPSVNRAPAEPPTVRAYGVDEARIGQAESLSDSSAESTDHLLGTSLAGARLYVSDFHGKALLVTYWSSACYACRAGMHRLRQVYRDYRLRGLEVVAVNTTEPRATVVDYLNRLDTPFPYAVAVGPTRRAPSVVPVTRVYDLEGVLAADYRAAEGFRSRDLRTDLERILPTAKK